MSGLTNAYIDANMLAATGFVDRVSGGESKNSLSAAASVVAKGSQRVQQQTLPFRLDLNVENTPPESEWWWHSRKTYMDLYNPKLKLNCSELSKYEDARKKIIEQAEKELMVYYLEQIDIINYQLFNSKNFMEEASDISLTADPELYGLTVTQMSASAPTFSFYNTQHCDIIMRHKRILDTLFIEFKNIIGELLEFIEKKQKIYLLSQFETLEGKNRCIGLSDEDIEKLPDKSALSISDETVNSINLKKTCPDVFGLYDMLVSEMSEDINKSPLYLSRLIDMSIDLLDVNELKTKVQTSLLRKWPGKQDGIIKDVLNGITMSDDTATRRGFWKAYPKLYSGQTTTAEEEKAAKLGGSGVKIQVAPMSCHHARGFLRKPWMVTAPNEFNLRIPILFQVDAGVTPNEYLSAEELENSGYPLAFYTRDFFEAKEKNATHSSFPSDGAGLLETDRKIRKYNPIYAKSDFSHKGENTYKTKRMKNVSNMCYQYRELIRINSKHWFFDELCRTVSYKLFFKFLDKVIPFQRDFSHIIREKYAFSDDPPPDEWKYKVKLFESIKKYLWVPRGQVLSRRQQITEEQKQLEKEELKRWLEAGGPSNPSIPRPLSMQKKPIRMQEPIAITSEMRQGWGHVVEGAAGSSVSPGGGGVESKRQFIDGERREARPDEFTMSIEKAPPQKKGVFSRLFRKKKGRGSKKSRKKRKRTRKKNKRKRKFRTKKYKSNRKKMKTRRFRKK